MKRSIAVISILAAALAATMSSCTGRLADGTYTLTVLSTNDVHSTWFDSTYVAGGGIRKSIYAMNYYIDSVRVAEGAENVVLVDAGDCLQGDNAAYYFNYVDTITPHLFPRLVEYMKYDAVAVGNHDIETGHPVYDRVTGDLRRRGSCFLAGNAVRNDDGQPYFPLYKMVRRAGLRIAILGYTNANIPAWLDESVWSGMHFDSIADIIQRDVDMVREKEKPDVVIATMHSACGLGDGTVLEAEAIDAFNKVSGVDFLVCGHDHWPYVETRDSCALLNSGSHSRYVAHGQLVLEVKDGKVASKTFSSKLIPVDAKKADPRMREHFQKDFEAVKAFVLKEVGVLNVDMDTRDSYIGMSPYMDLIHSVCLSCEPTEISLAAPLTFDGHLSSGILVFNDFYTLYPFENQLYVITMTGAEVKDYLEASYARWIRTITDDGHILNIQKRDDPRNQKKGWSFVERAYNFDSAAGITYNVDVTRPEGERIRIISMADGSAFDPERTYNVSVTSYRASGGGGLLDEAGVDTDEINSRIVKRYPEIRFLLYDYMLSEGSIDPEKISDRKVTGSWKFVPERIANEVLRNDMTLLFH